MKRLPFVPKVTAPAVDAAFWRRMAFAGARYGPRPWVRYSPPLFGLAFAALLPELRARVRDNLRRVLGQRSPLEEHVDVARTFATYARCLAESLARGRPEAERARRRMRGTEHLERAVAAGRGIMLVTAHTGAWDAAAHLLPRDAGLEVLVVMHAEPDARARLLHDQVRHSEGVRIVHVGAHPLDSLPLLQHLKAGGVVAAQIDRSYPGQRSLEVDLFGRPFKMPEGPFVLSALVGAPVLPVFVRRVDYFDYEFSISPAIELPRRAGPDDIRRAAERAAGEMERFIRAHPTQWFHFGGD